MKYYSFLKTLAKNAGKIIEAGYFGEINFKEKSTQDYITQFDIRVEKFIKKQLSKKYPTHNILAEESGSSDDKKSDYLWIIDPIDGTTNFIHKIPMCAISIALEYKKKLIAGLVYNPITKEFFYAEKNSGAYLNGKKLRIGNSPKIKDWFLAWCYPDSMRNEKGIKRIFDLFYPKCLRITKLGSAAIELAYVASGRVDGYISTGLKKWDYAAGELIVKEAGGVLLKERIGKGNLFIASSKKNAKIILAMLRD